MQAKPAVRKQYGLYNYNEGNTPDFFGDYENALRASAPARNAGQTLQTHSPGQGGVLPGDAGQMLTRNMFYGFVSLDGSSISPSGITPGQTYLSQRANPTGWAGDAPLDLQDAPQRAAPWRRTATGGNPRGTFSSGANARRVN